MRSLDDILIGFIIFFALERGIRLISNAIVEPWALKRSGNPERAENWKLAAEFGLLMVSLYFVWKYQKQIANIAKTP